MRIRATLSAFLKNLIGIAAVVSIERLFGREHWYGTEIDPNTGHETLYSIIRRRQDELRDRRI